MKLRPSAASNPWLLEFCRFGWIVFLVEAADDLVLDVALLPLPTNQPFLSLSESATNGTSLGLYIHPLSRSRSRSSHCDQILPIMKRKRTLSGIRGALDYKNLNVFGDIVANFHGRNIPSVEDFSTYLQSHDYCDNLKFLSNQSNSTKQPENPPINNTTGDKVAKRGRKPKKPSPDDDVNSEEPPSNAFEPPAQIMPPVMGSIGHFFYRFSQTYPRGTKIYNTFVTLARVCTVHMFIPFGRYDYDYYCFCPSLP